MYDAVLLVSFGGPDGPDDVMPFLENVLRGKHVPRERMLEVAEHYHHFGGASPINEQCRQLLTALREELARRDIRLPLYWGNRNWHPLLPETLRQMGEAGIRRALAIFTSPYSSYSSCRQYRENLADARSEVGQLAPEVEKIRAYFNHPGFVEAMQDRLREALGQLPEPPQGTAHLLFTAHSIPLAMARNCRYEAQLAEASRLVAEAAPGCTYELVYQSRSGPPQQPWLEPDVCDVIERIASEGGGNLVIVPIGFISDHMEVLYDLDVEARDKCDQLGLTMVRCPTVGTHPRFITMFRELIEERLSGSPDRPVVGRLPPVPDVCPVDCCLYTPARPPAR